MRAFEEALERRRLFKKKPCPRTGIRQFRRPKQEIEVMLLKLKYLLKLGAAHLSHFRKLRLFRNRPA
jgi:hypothetical protein